MTTAVVDLGVGNTASMLFALARLGTRATLTRDAAVIAGAARVILPGVGAAAWVMGRVEALGLAETLTAFARPLLGACLGMQLLYDESAEGPTPCLALIAGRVEPIVPAPERPVPHMGWNQLHRRRDHPLTEGVPDGAYVYFVHGYAAPPGPETLADADYGGPFSAIVAHGNAMGCQFHPERSGAVGSRILANFLDLPC